MSDNELPGMWESADFTGGADEVRGPVLNENLAAEELNDTYREKSRDLVRAADAAQYVREAIPEEQKGQIRVRLLNATPDPLGSIASSTRATSCGTSARSRTSSAGSA